MLQFDIWQIVGSYFCPKLFTIDYLNCVQLKCLAGIRVRTQ